MDYVGDADQLDDDDPFRARGPVLTPEARVFTGIGLVLTGLFANTLFQVLAFFVVNNGESSARWTQWSIYAAPMGVLGLVAAVLAAPVRRQTDSTALQGAAVALVVVGVLLAVLALVGYVAIAQTDPARF